MDIDDIDLSRFKNLYEYISTLVDHGLTKPSTDAPFDCSHCISIDFSVFGDLGTGPLRGKHVHLTCTPPDVIDQSTGETVDLPDIGEVVGDDHGRIIIALETEEAVYFFGWLTSEDYNILDVHQEAVSWLH